MKDTFWCLHWVVPALFMILPTLSVAIWLLIKNRKDKTDLAHNAAVLCWISANIIWMVGEFYTLESDLTPISLSLFVLGLFILTVFYGSYFIQKMKQPLE